jgi:hypothetical protein
MISIGRFSKKLTRTTVLRTRNYIVFSNSEVAKSLFNVAGVFLIGLDPLNKHI